jgi:methionyl aminopeptidase
MMRLKNREEISRIRESGHLLSETFKNLEKLIDEGIESQELDAFAHDFIIKGGGKPSFLGYMNYPASLCVSINKEVIHGIPGKRKLKRGDIVSVDIGIDLHGFYSDAAHTYVIGAVSAERRQLLRVTEECLYRAVEAAKTGNRVNDISKAVSAHASDYGYGIVRQYCGHGVGFSQHEDPQIPNYVGNGPNPKLKAGMVLAIEPMINTGTWEVIVREDGWTVETADGADSAHFEYTIALFEDDTEVLTPFA